MLKKAILLLICFSCFLTYSQKNQSDLTTWFSDSEIADLNLIADFLQEEICRNSDRDQFANCITISLPDLLSLGYIQENISWRKQQKLYAKISDSTFYKIWSFYDTRYEMKPKPEYIYKSIGFSGNTTFIKFVKALAESNPGMEGYGKQLEGHGTFGFIGQQIFVMGHNPDKIDLNNRGVQFLLAIEILTANDREQRDKKVKRLEKRYLRKRNRGLKQKK